jgi:hypothetical protein
MIATLRVGRITLGTRAVVLARRREACLLVRPPISGARSVYDCDAPRRADRARNLLPSSSLGDEKRVSSFVLRSAARDPGSPT